MRTEQTVAGTRTWDPSAGAFGSLTGALHRLLAVQVALLVATIPTMAGFLLLDRDASNAVLYALAAVPVGPAVQAGLYALRRSPEDETRPWRRYWRGWRSGLRQSLTVWTPAVALAAIALFNSAHAATAGTAPWLVTTGLLVAGAVAVWATAALAVIATFEFRTRDLGRVVVFGLGSRPLTAVGVLCVMVLALALIAFTFDAVLALAAVAFCYALLLTVRPMLQVIAQRLTAEGEGAW